MLNSHHARRSFRFRGCLYLVGTPIGNLEDITFAALRILKESDQIACEDTRHTQKLLSHYEISKPLVSYHEHNEMTRAPELVVAMEQGAKIASSVTPACRSSVIPAIDSSLSALAIKFPVIPIPGPSALLAALAASGLPNEEFLFVGFLPARTGERRRALERLRIEDRTLILYEAPHRVAEPSPTPAKSWATVPPASPAKSPKSTKNSAAPRSPNSLPPSKKNRPRRNHSPYRRRSPRPSSVVGDTSQSLADRVDELIRQAKLDRRKPLSSPPRNAV